MSCFDWIREPVNIPNFLELIIFFLIVELDTESSSDATETDTKEASCNGPKGEEESVPMEAAKKREARDGGKLIPASQAVSPRPGSTQENQVVLTTVNTHFNLDGSARSLGLMIHQQKCTVILTIWRRPCCIHWLSIT